MIFRSLGRFKKDLLETKHYFTNLLCLGRKLIKVLWKLCISDSHSAEIFANTKMCYWRDNNDSQQPVLTCQKNLKIESRDHVEKKWSLMRKSVNRKSTSHDPKQFRNPNLEESNKSSLFSPNQKKKYFNLNNMIHLADKIGYSLLIS